MTRVWQVNPTSDIDALLRHPAVIEAAEALRRGEVVAFPTETVYGLGAIATDDAAVARIFTAKGRPSDNPLIVHLADVDALPLVARDIPEDAMRLFSRFSPGPLTLILFDRGVVSRRVTAGLPTVAVRIPAHPVARALIRRVALPLAAPSANRSGRPSPTRAEHVLADLDGIIYGLLDGGAAEVGIESTVLDLTRRPYVVLRPGSVTREALSAVLGPGAIAESAREGAADDAPDGGAATVAGDRPNAAPRAPGMKYRHYAPDVPLTVLARSALLASTAGRIADRPSAWASPTERPEVDLALRALFEAAREAHAAGKRVAVLAAVEDQARLSAMLASYGAADLRAGIEWISLGHLGEPETVARSLYAALRRLSPEHTTRAFAVALPEEGLFQAVMNRLRKAAESE